MDKQLLSFTYNQEIKRSAEDKRKANIMAFSKIDRSGLEHGKIERKLFLYRTFADEHIWIQYPGKETKTGRPWDFRPKMVDANDENIKDLSFPDIWDDLTEMHTNSPEALQVLAAMFARMAFMVDYRMVSRDFTYEDFDIESGEVFRRGTENIEFYMPVLNRSILEELQEDIGCPRGFSLAAYLLYNDLLVQNEDCKYYYRDMVAEGAKGEWKANIGRRNTLLTHLTVIQFIQGNLSFSAIMKKFQGGQGVAPINLSLIPEVTGGIIQCS